LVVSECIIAFVLVYPAGSEVLPYVVHVSDVEAACMRKKSRKPPSRRVVLRLPDLDHTKSAVLNSLSSPHSRRNYKFAMEQFITWYCSEPRLAVKINKPILQPRFILLPPHAIDSRRCPALESVNQSKAR
jgi:hypothetical protein